MEHRHSWHDMGLQLRLLLVLAFASLTMFHNVEPAHESVADICLDPSCAQSLRDAQRQAPLRAALAPSVQTEDTQVRATAPRDRKAAGACALPHHVATVNMATTPPPAVPLRGQQLERPPFRSLPSWQGMISFALPPPFLRGQA